MNAGGTCSAARVLFMAAGSTREAFQGLLVFMYIILFFYIDIDSAREVAFSRLAQCVSAA